MHEENSKKIFVFAGENSGDLHGSRLIAALQERDPSIMFEGVCGPHMRAMNQKGPLKMEEFEVMGLTDVLLALPRLYRNFHKILEHILTTSPCAVILIDYPGFNLRLAKALRKQGYQGKIIQYVSPSVWAWGQHRIQAMAETLDLLMLIYPFESSYFTHSSLNTVYVGNPIQEYIRNYSYDDAWHDKLGIASIKNTIALFPGSRNSEISRNLPLLLDAAKYLLESDPHIQFAVSCPNPFAKHFFNTQLASLPPSLQSAFFQVPKEYTYELMRDSRTAVAKSGTVTLELALHRRPTVVMYKLTLLNRFYAKYILKLKLPYYCIANILANSQVFPEFIEKNFNSRLLSQQLQQLNENGPERIRSIEACDRLSQSLGIQNASCLAAQSILDELSC